MKRICLLGAAMAGLLTAGITTAAVASPSHAVRKPAKTKTASKDKRTTARLSCSLRLVTQIPTHDVTVTQGAQTGMQYGSVGCGSAGGARLAGVERDSFTENSSGVLTGPYQQWFNDGSVYGQYTLTPVDATAPPTTSSFTSQSYKGTVSITNGTGVFAKATGKDGTLTCSTGDAAHYSCTESLQMTQTTSTKKATAKHKR